MLVAVRPSSLQFSHLNVLHIIQAKIKLLCEMMCSDSGNRENQNKSGGVLNISPLKLKLALLNLILLH